jgi:hypothetical protein
MLCRRRMLTNYLDPEGRPICLTCGKAIKPLDSTARVDDCMTHLACFRSARERANAGLDPCAPVPQEGGEGRKEPSRYTASSARDAGKSVADADVI